MSYAMGYKIIMASRSKEKLQASIDWFRSREFGPNYTWAEFVELDVGEPVQGIFKVSTEIFHDEWIREVLMADLRALQARQPDVYVCQYEADEESEGDAHFWFTGVHQWQLMVGDVEALHRVIWPDEQRKKEPKLKKVARAILAIHDEPASEPTPGLKEAQ